MSDSEFINTGLSVIRSNTEQYVEQGIDAEGHFDHGVARLHGVLRLLRSTAEEISRAHVAFEETRDTLIGSTQAHIEPAMQLGQELGLELMTNPSGPELAAALGEIAASTTALSDLCDHSVAFTAPQSTPLNKIDEILAQVTALCEVSGISDLRNGVWAATDHMESAVEDMGIGYE